MLRIKFTKCLYIIYLNIILIFALCTYRLCITLNNILITLL